MIEIDIRGIAEVQRMLRGLADEQIPFAVSTAINTVAFKAKNAIQSEMKAVFDRPTPWTIRQIAVAKATKKDLTAVIGTPEGIKDAKGNNAGFSRYTSSGIFERILTPHIEGGARLPRPAEVRLRKAGILPDGWVAVPGKTMKLDQYGNLSSAWWLIILSWLNALQWSSQGANQNRAQKTSKRKNKLEKKRISLFAVIPNRGASHLLPGVYMRQGRKISMALLFVSTTGYRARLDWYGVLLKTVERELPEAMSTAIQRAIDTER